MGIAEVLTIIFVVLKCLGHIAWSWWWVFCPLWIVYGGVVCVFAIIALVALINYALCTR